MKEIFFRANQYLFFFVLVVVVMFFGKGFLIPVFFAGLLSMLMAPVCNKLESWGLNRPLACVSCILMLILIFAGIALVVSIQFATFAENITQIQTKAKEFLDQAQGYIQDQFGVTPEKQEQVVKEQAEKNSQANGSMATKILGGVSSTIAGMILTLVITFLMIFNKEQFETFFVKLYKEHETEKIKGIVGQISKVGQKYLTGRAMSITINFALYAIGLMIVGVKNAVLLAGIAAILTIIPYVGTVLGGLFPVLMALITQDNQTALSAALVLIFIQACDNYFIEPNVVGGEVKLNALWSILSILIGGMIWGVAGMILFLPMFGIIKIVCDHVDSLKPIGYLLGEPGGAKPSKIKLWIKDKLGMGKKKSNRKTA
ncbi:MAG: AI-2E family transporter [Cyclobacteriaceae bacterium]